MALDTVNTRLAVQQRWLPCRRIPPMADGTIDAPDRLMLMGGPAVASVVVVIPIHMVTMAARQMAVSIPARPMSVVIFAETQEVTIPARVMAVTVGDGLVPETLQKQPSERIPLRMTFQDVPSGAVITGGTAYASDATQDVNQAIITAATTMSALAAAGALTIQLAADPGIGSRLTIGTGGTTEVQKVSNVTGSSPPFTATINPGLWFAHSNGEAVIYEQGVSTMFIVDTAVDPVPPNAVDLEVRHGAHAHRMRVSAIVTLDSGSILEGEVYYSVIDD